jgi:23S rRNA pseudouridine2605 synthase
MAHGRSPTHVRKRRRKARTAATPPAPAQGRVRLQKLLAGAGHGSRRGCEEMIRAGRVRVNGHRAELGEVADPGRDVIELDGERLVVDAPRYWLLHKPKGIVTTVNDTHGRRTVMHFMPPGVGRVYPVGRLDRDSTGLLLLTNDGDLAQRLLHPSHESEKEYRVTVKGELLEKSIARLRTGVRLEDGRTAPAKVAKLHFDPDSASTIFHLTLVEGRNRQIRRAMLILGNPVRKLVRVRMGPLVLGSLPPGGTRPLRGDEVRALKTYASGLRPARRGRAAGSRRRGESRA